jgi:hypothetical protein
VNVTKETATVYRGGGRRWFTKKAACTAEARARLKADCGCDYCDHEGYGRENLPCQYHDGSERADKILRRLAAIYYRAALSVGETKGEA